MTTDPVHPTQPPAQPVRHYEGSETKASYKTTEFIVYIVMVLGVLIASAIADEESDFGAQEAWKFITFLTVGYMLSRGLAKSGTRAATEDDHQRVRRS